MKTEKNVVRCFLVLIFLFHIGGCMKSFDPVKNDEFCADLISNTDSETITNWLKLKSKGIEITLGEMSETDTDKIIEKISSFGDPEVWVVEIERDDGEAGFENSGQICIALPQDNINRTKLLDMGNKIANKLGFDSVPDMGQKFLYISFD